MAKFIADLQIHSKYSRATSKDMILEEIDRWAHNKGIAVMGTGDFAHPAWFKEIKQKLEPAEPGLFKLKKEFKLPTLRGEATETRFMLTVEISGIYSRNKRVYRVHNMIFAPDVETAEKINTHLGWIGNLASDGRPILGLDSEELAKIVFEINPRAVVVPAHCLFPGTIIHTKEDLMKEIKNIQVGDLVLTHKNRWQKVSEVLRRPYEGKMYSIRPYYFREGLQTTPEHPFYAIKTAKNCHWSGGICKPAHESSADCTEKSYKSYKPEWIMADQLEVGDVLIYPRFKNTFSNHSSIAVKDFLDMPVKEQNDVIRPMGTRGTFIKNSIPITKEFCRLVGYYLAEGYTNGRDAVAFTFKSNEEKYIEDVVDLVQKVFSFDGKVKIRQLPGDGKEIIFFSKILQQSFSNLFYGKKPFNASSKALPMWMLGLSPDKQVEIFKGWWYGDKGYTVSRLLMNQMKIILLRLGIIPSVYIEKIETHSSRSHIFQDREIKARYDMYSLSRLSFLEDAFNLLSEPEFAHFKSKTSVRHGWLDAEYAYLPIRDIEISNYKGDVYNLEVKQDNSYTSEFATIHNCWTPWFSVFGSMSGFDSLEECFGDYAKYIFAVETGLSSDPAMNWRLSKLDDISLISNSDSHSLQRIGREANIFDLEPSYDNIIAAVKSRDPNKFIATIEFFPEEGKYHLDGHRVCGVCFEPPESKKHNNICPKCGKKLTIGVLNRVEELADREPFKTDFKNNRHNYAGRIPYYNAVPLNEIIAKSLGVGTASLKVKREYENLIKMFGSEFKILMELPLQEMEKSIDGKIVSGIQAIREGKVIFDPPGYDGEYGRMKFADGAMNPQKNQDTLF